MESHISLQKTECVVFSFLNSLALKIKSMSQNKLCMS